MCSVVKLLCHAMYIIYRWVVSRYSSLLLEDRELCRNPKSGFYHDRPYAVNHRGSDSKLLYDSLQYLVALQIFIFLPKNQPFLSCL